MKKEPYRILLANDDGIDAPGLQALYNQIKTIGEVTVIAPDGEQSAVSHAVSLFSEMHLRKVFREANLWGYALAGTPVDCVKLAVTKIMKDAPPHLVISGINRGQNTGNSILYSGTVAAAIEAAMFGIPSIAASLHCHRVEQPHFAFAAKFIRALALRVLEHGLPKDVLLNVNFPNVSEEEINGIVVSRQGQSMYVDLYKEVREEGEKIILRNVGEELIASNEGEDIDDFVIFQNKVSITPLHYNLTFEPFRDELKEWIHNLF